MKPRFFGVGIMVIGLTLVVYSDIKGWDYAYVGLIGGVIIVFGAFTAWYLERGTKKK